MQNQSLLIGAIAVVAIGAAAYLWMSDPATEEVVTTDATVEMTTETMLEVTGERVSYFPEANGYFAQPTEPGIYPGVIMIHENRGLRPEIVAEADELAAQGYLVLAVDLYKGTVMETQEEARAYGSQYSREEGVANMQAAADFLRAAGATKLASLGWCFGGAESLALSTSGEMVDATVIYYGRLTEDTAELAKLNGPVLGIFGDADQVVPVDSVATFEANLAALNIPAEIHMYEGVGHAFANPSNPNFAPTETADAWEKTLAFLAENLQ